MKIGRQWQRFTSIALLAAFQMTGLILAPSGASAAALLPLVTQDVQTLPDGIAEAVIGFTYSDNGRFPGFITAGALRRQTVVQVPQLGFNVGVGDWAEFQVSYETIYLYEQATNGQTNTQFGGGDARVFAKFHFLNETRYLPGFGFWFGAKLPDATRDSFLGTDDGDFTGDWLLSKDFGLFSGHANLGIELLGNAGPLIGDTFTAGGQDDLFDYNLALVSKPLGAPVDGATTLRLLAEFTGTTGSRFGNDRNALRFGLQANHGNAGLYLGVTAGLVTASENVGVNGGFIYTFDAASLLHGLKRALESTDY